MERGVRDLCSRGVAMKVKEEMDDCCGGDSRDFMRGSGIQRSFKTVQEVRSNKTTEAFDANHKTAICSYQKSLTPTEQGSANYAMAAYPSHQFNYEIKETSVSNHKISVAMNSPFFKTHVASTSNNPVTSTVRVSHSIVPVADSVITRSISNSTGSVAQLTIFYAGMVNVFDDVSPEKAHAIRFLAGDGSPTNVNIIPRAQSLKQVGSGDEMPEKQIYLPLPCSVVPPSISVTSNVGPHAGSGFSSNNRLIVAKPLGALTVPTMQLDSQKLTPLVPAGPTLIPSAVPQARRASLARFLEKRKERVMNKAPYDTKRKSPESILTSESSGGDSAAGSLPGNKDQS